MSDKTWTLGSSLGGTANLRDVERVIGTTAADTMTGDALDNWLSGRDGGDRLSGGAGSDAILGGDGDDIIDGGRGSDTIDGGRGTDQMQGGAGRDTFDFTGVVDSLAGARRDVVTGFAHGQDVIDVSEIDAISGGANDAFTFLGGGKFTGAGGEITVDQKAGSQITVISFDIDGDKRADMQIELNGLVTLTDIDCVL